MKHGLKISLLGVFTLIQIGTTWAQIPSEYEANYRIAGPWNQVNESMIRIEALRKTGTQIPTSLFSQLKSDFESVFQYLPQNANNKLTYEQCRITTQKLSIAYANDDFGTFYNQCYTPLLDIINFIGNQRTVKANIVVSPSSGPAPHNVTLDARGSSDPSQDTIPNNNYYWYFSDVDGVKKTLGIGPVINHTFRQPGKYMVHLTTRSVNRSDGVFDGEATAEVNVSPQSAIITVHANGKKMKEDTFVKIGTTEAQNGVTLDGTSTTPTGGRRIISHKWSLVGQNFSSTQEGRGDPSVRKIALPGNGQYTVTLTTFDNENNQLSAEFSLVVSDPVATIKASPEQGTTSTRFLFDGGNSYSVSSRLKTYKWEVFDPQGNLNDTITARQISKQFSKPGLYTIKLTVVDELGQSNIDQFKLYVESTAPVPQFAINATQDRDKASQFIIDASSSNDIDQIHGDKLTYEWKFSDPNIVKVEQYSDDKKKAIITFNQIGTHQITLTVRDSYGKYADITKQVEVKSTLRPTLQINPVATVRGKAINFTVQSNQPIINYQWEFGDGTTHMSQFDKISHTYNNIGIYKVRLTVTNNKQESNTTYAQVFIGEVDKPIALYQVSSQQYFDGVNQTILPVGDCSGNNAYLVDRYQNVFIDAGMSVNTKGQNSNLNIYFKPQNDRVISASSMRYQFGEIGCHAVDITVQDQAQTTQDKKTIYFKVRNALPALGNITINFPQYGNEAGIGFFNNNSSDPTFETFEPLVVRLTAENVGDSDGYISYYTWYYYKADDPDRILDLKITPGNTNTVTFALSREAGEYVFGVKLTDNDDETIRSESIIGKGPVVFLNPKGGESGDIPIVTLKSSQTNAKIGEAIIFKVDAKILSSRDDFVGTRVFKYDFDGDGIDDLTTKLDEVTHTYTTASPDEGFKPKVKVLYRGKTGVGFGDTMIIKKGLKPNFIYAVIDKKVIITDLTLGADEKSTIAYCMNMRYCAEDISYMINNQKSFIFEYPSYGKYVVKLETKDEYGNIESMRQIIDIPQPTGAVPTITTLPITQQGASGATVSVGKALNNTISLFVSQEQEQNCFIDINNKKDNNNDGDPTNDNDLSCNQLHQVTFTTPEPSVGITIHKSNTKELITVNLIDNQTVVEEKYQNIGTEITSIITQLGATSGTNLLQDALLGLRSNLGDTAKTTEYIVDIQNLIQSSSIDTTTTTRINTILESLRNASSEAAQGNSPIEQAKAEILSLVDSQTKQTLLPYFEQIENNGGNRENVIEQLSNILTTIKKQVDSGNFDPQDYTIVRTQVCAIATYREVSVNGCDSNTDDIKPIPDSPSSSVGSSFSKILRIAVIIIIGGGLIFVGFIIYYAMKARRKHKQEINEQQ